MPNFFSRITNNAVTPLWIIAIFLSLTEVDLGNAVVKTTSTVQMALTIFVMIFPTLIALGFFLVLWYKPQAFYPPAGSAAQDAAPLAGGRVPAADGRLYDDLRRNLLTTLLSDEMVASLSQPGAQQEIRSLLAGGAEKALEALRAESFIEVDTAPFLGAEGGVLQLPYREYPGLAAFLLALGQKIGAYRYNQSWVLRDARTGKVFSDLGKELLEADNRSLRDIGLTAGMKLEVIALR